MKTSKLVLGLMLSLFVLSCSNEDVNQNPVNTFNADEAKINVNIDAISDDITKIIDDQYDRQKAEAGRTSIPPSFLPPCATVTTTVSQGTWTRTIDFGNVGCEMPNGNILKGKIIISASVNFNQSSHVISYTFLNFYHNNKLIQGNRTAVRTIQNGMPTTNLSMNLSVTFPNGNVYTRIGTRTRVMTHGYNTPQVWSDNIFSITGNWTTTFPTGTQTATISSSNPLIVKMSCDLPFPVSGTITFVRNNHTAVLDYGTGACDNLATLTINGNTTTITLGN